MKAENTPAAKAAFPEPPRKAGARPQPRGTRPQTPPEASPGRPREGLHPAPPPGWRHAPGRPSLATTDRSWEPLPNQRSKRCRCI